MRAAIYARVSTDRQEQEQTIQSQLEALRKYAQDKGYEVAGEYLDDGYSGARLDRPALDRLRDGLRSGEFDLVLVYSPDRLARKATYQGLLLDEIKRAGIRVEFVNHPVDDTPAGRMMLGVEGLFSEYERDLIAERYRRGKLHWARQGAVLGGFTPYGYRYVPRHKESNIRGMLVVDEAEAAVVRMMYRWLLEDRLSCRAIAKRLAEMEVLTKRGNSRWSPSTVNGILKQEVHKGIYFYHRNEAVEPSRRTSKEAYRRRKLTVKRIRPTEDWIAIKVPAIIEEGTWEQAQQQLRQNFMHSTRNNTRRQYLLRGLIRCPACAATYVGAFARGKRYYHCNRTDPLESASRKCLGAARIPAEPVEEVVWSAIRDAVRSPQLLIDEYRRRQGEMETPDATETERRQIELAIKRVKGQQDRVTDAYVNEAMDLPEYKSRMGRLRQRKQQLEAQLADLGKRAERQAQGKEALAKLDDFCERVARGLDNLTFEEQQELLRLLIERITVIDSKVRIEAIIPLEDGGDRARLCPPRIESPLRYLSPWL